jgi:hypothetical protein
MNAEIYTYTFSSAAPVEEIEETLHLAILAAEGLHGRSRVRLDASYYMEGHSCVIDAGTEVGRDIVRLFTGFAIKEFGEEAFRVRRENRK